MRLVEPGRWAGTGLVLSFLALVAAAAPRATAPTASATGVASLIEPMPGDGLRTTAVRHYRMDGRIRPLLFWFGKDDIGLARITWRAATDGARGYEMLVGTDPQRAPRALNKWGFIAEQVSGTNGRLLALMTGNDTASYDDAAADAEQAHTSGDFRAILASVEGGAGAWRTARINTATALSIHDVDATLDRVRQEASAVAARQQPLPAGTRPGFLVALAELIESGANQPPGSPAARTAGQQRLRYAFGQGLYELSLRGSERTTVTLDRGVTPVIRSSFEIRTLATDARTRFDVLFGTSGTLAQVPVAAEWQPRWWLKVALRLADSAGS